MKLLASKHVVNYVSYRFVGYKKRMRLKGLKDHSYVPWKSAEVVESIEETLKTPYQQIIPTSAVKRISETNPANHSHHDLGKFYTIPEEDRERFFLLSGFPGVFAELTRTFNENSIMIRKPALEIIDNLKNANYDKLPVKYVLYGEAGCGKRTTRLHVLHYALRNGFVVFDFPAVHQMHIYGRKEAHVSETRPPFIDLPLEAALFLKNFHLQNTALIEDLKMQTTKEYVWNQRETTPAGTPLMTLVNHGINRVKYACDCLDALVHELKLAANDGQLKLFVDVEGFNSFLADKTEIRIDGKYGVDTRQTTIYQSLLKFFEPNWNNGAILLNICERFTQPKYRGSPFPFFLLRREGFELLDPFVPVEVPRLSELEFHSLLDYYEDRRWLQKIGGREELEFLSNRNPGDIMLYCSSI